MYSSQTSGIEVLRQAVTIRADEVYIKMLNSAAMFGACSSLSAAGLDNTPIVEQIGYLFDRCPNKKGFEHMEIVPLVYLEHCLRNHLLESDGEWLEDMIQRIRNRHGNNLVFKMLRVILSVS